MHSHLVNYDIPFLMLIVAWTELIIAKMVWECV